MARPQRRRRHGGETGESARVLADGGDWDRRHEDPPEAGDPRAGPRGLAGRDLRVPRPVPRGGEGEGRGLAGPGLPGEDGRAAAGDPYGPPGPRRGSDPPPPEVN